MLKLNDNISETLLITLYMKYLASQQPNPVIYDKSALALVPQIDYNFAQFDTSIGSLLGCAIRARYFDQLAADFIRRVPNAVIVQLGCGLDDRAGRIGNTVIPFVQLDLPDVIELRRQWLPPKTNEILLAASILETDWLDNLKQSFPQSRFLFIAEGVLMYFPRDTVRDVFVRLAQFHGSEIGFDACSSLAVKKQERHDTLRYMQARFEYGCDNPHEMENWADNLQLVSDKYYVDFPEFKRAGAIYWMMRLLPFIKKTFKLLHYRIV